MLMKPTAGRPQRAATSRSAVVLGHQYALEAEEYASSGHLDRAEQLEQLASQCYLRALDDIAANDVKTRAALKLIAENHEQRAVRWQMALMPDATPRPSFPPPSTTTTTTAAPFVPAQTSAKSETPSSSAPHSATSMREAASEMEDLFERLKALGLPGYATNGGARPASKQYLSSDLGDSFCLLPTGNARMPLVSRVDGETTLKAAIGNRNKNHRERYLSQLSTAPSSRLSIPSPIKEDEIMPSPEKPPHHDDDGLSSSPSTDAMEHLRAALATHKHEIARLTHTVKTLSTENAKLRQDVQSTEGMADENKRLTQTMETFKLEYNQKFVVLKRALEEWRRQQQRQDAKPSHIDVEDSPLVAELRAELDAAQRTAQEKDVLLQKYEAWFNSLKASAKAKQQTRGVDTQGNRTSAFAQPSLPPRPPSTQQQEL